MSKFIQPTTFPPGVKVTLTGMIIPPGLPFQEWEDAVELTSQTRRRKQMEIIALDWALVDLLNYGEREYGQKYAQAVLVTGLSGHTLANKCWAGNKIPRDERVEGLTIEHHAAVAALPAPERDALLDEAKSDSTITVLDLRTKVQNRRMREAGKDPDVERAKAALEAAWVAVAKLPRTKRAQLVVERLILPLAEDAKQEREMFYIAVINGIREQYLAGVLSGVCDIE